MTFDSALTTRDELLGYLGSVQIPDQILDDLANGADALIQAACGTHPLISHADDTPAQIADKMRQLAQRRSAFYALTSLAIRRRDEGLPTFNGEPSQTTAGYEADTQMILGRVGIRDWQEPTSG